LGSGYSTHRPSGFISAIGRRARTSKKETEGWGRKRDEQPSSCLAYEQIESNSSPMRSAVSPSHPQEMRVGKSVHVRVKRERKGLDEQGSLGDVDRLEVDLLGLVGLERLSLYTPPQPIRVREGRKDAMDELRFQEQDRKERGEDRDRPGMVRARVETYSDRPSFGDLEVHRSGVGNGSHLESCL
jgi:hypothetical protein